MEYVTSHEAAKAWGWHKTTVTRRCSRGIIPGAFKDELGKWRIPASESPPSCPPTSSPKARSER